MREETNALQEVGELLQLLQTMRPADILDIAIVSVIAYAALIWVRRSRSRLALGGLAALVILYFVARMLQLHLTLYLFQLVVTAAVVALVVVFQEDIRRGFEQLTLRRPTYRGSPESLDVIDVITSAASRMADRKRGALIVVKGRDPLARHLSGGVRLDGKVSEPLLDSIFDASSDGHDGAAIVEGTMLTHFGVHLPLSSEVKGGRHYGTRHTAALGLAERCDALVIVVSEERGRISLAEGGELVTIDSSSRLRERLAHFIATHYPEKPRPRWQRLVADNLGIKLLSIALAAVGWFIVLGVQRESVVRSYVVPVTFHDLPAHWMIDDVDPNTVRVTFSGPTQIFRGLNESELSIKVDAAKLEPGRQRTTLAPAQVAAPERLEVTKIDPARVQFRAHQLVPSKLKVEPTTRGQLPGGLRLKRLNPDPAEVSLLVRKARESGLKHIDTKPIDLDKIEKSITVRVPLWLPDDARLAEGAPDEVKVEVVVGDVVPASEAQSNGSNSAKLQDRR